MKWRYEVVDTMQPPEVAFGTTRADAAEHIESVLARLDHSDWNFLYSDHGFAVFRILERDD